MKRRTFTFRFTALFLCALLLFTALPVFQTFGDDGDTPIIVVDALTERGRVSPYTLGSNHRHAYGGFGMYDTENGEVYSEFLDMTKDAKLGTVRYPGGTIANLFTWKDTVGPISERRNVVLGNSYESVFPYYGLDEHMQYTEAIGAEVIYMVGEAAETPEGAADLVEYLNGVVGENKNGGIDWAKKRAENGHPEPYGVVYFEIGNEMYHANQQYWLDYPSALGDTDRARRYMRGDTVAVTGSIARRYGTWKDNVSDGSASQEFYTQYNPAVEGTDKVYVNGEKWTRVASFEGASASDKVYTFEPVSGKITFGDGVKGMKPVSGAKITVDYHHKHAGFTAYYDAMKAVDPDIKIFANLPWAFNFVEGVKCDGIVYHNYFTYPNTLSSAEDLHDAYIEMAGKLVRAIDGNVAQLRERTKRQDTIAAVTEFGSIDNPLIYSDNSSDYGREEARSLSRALSFALTYMGSSKAESLIHIHQAYTAYSFGGGEKLPNADFVYNSMYAPYGDDPTKFVEGATALAYKLIGNNIGDSYRTSFIENNPIVGDIAEYQALTSTVSVDEKTGDLYLLVVNADKENDIQAKINLKGYTVSGKARIQTLNADDIAATNTPEHPNDITITESEATFGGSSFAYTFPAHSFVAIKLSGTDSEFYTETLNESFDAVEISTLPDAFSLSGTASMVALEGGKALRLERSSSNGSLTVSLSEDSTPLDGITRIRFKLSAEQTSRARIQVDLNRSEGTTMMFAMEEGFVKNDAKIRAVYTQGTLHEFEIVADNRSGEYILFFDGSYIGSPGQFDPDTGLEGITFTTMTQSGSFVLDGVEVLSASTEVGEIPAPPVTEAPDTTPDTTSDTTPADTTVETVPPLAPDTTVATPVPDSTPIAPTTTSTPVTDPGPDITPDPDPENSPTGLIIGIVAAVVLLGGGITAWFVIKKKRSA